MRLNFVLVSDSIYAGLGLIVCKKKTCRMRCRGFCKALQRLNAFLASNWAYRALQDALMAGFAG
jgi:hypothetical protein